MWKNFLIAHPRNKRKQVQVFCWHNELPVEQVLCSTSLYPSKQNVIRHTPSISNFWKPRRAHSWFLKTLAPGPDHCTWTWAWPRQSFYVRTIASILSNAKISRMTVAISQWIWERKGCPVTSQWAFKHHSVWSCSELRGPCAPLSDHHPCALPVGCTIEVNGTPSPARTAVGLTHMALILSCPHTKGNIGLVCSSTLPRQIETSPSTSATSGICERTGCTSLPELQFGLWSHAAEYFVIMCPLIKMELHRGFRSSTL